MKVLHVIGTNASPRGMPLTWLPVEVYNGFNLLSLKMQPLFHHLIVCFCGPYLTTLALRILQGDQGKGPSSPLKETFRVSGIAGAENPNMRAVYSNTAELLKLSV